MFYMERQVHKQHNSVSPMAASVVRVDGNTTRAQAREQREGQGGREERRGSSSP